MGFARSAADIDFHAGNAAAAAATAARASSTPPSATSATVASVAGLRTANRRPPRAGTKVPPMKQSVCMPGG